MITEKKVGKVFAYFPKIGVAAVQITEDHIEIGDTIHFKGNMTDFEQEIESMQIDKKEVDYVEAGKSVGIQVNEKVKPGDEVYKAL
ncbi:translation elongation factor-like protein [Candidatus Woesearchaeota archaeon]|nr:translation elongation factor-like protein [Candidatus Woesearchaeota archaeon]